MKLNLYLNNTLLGQYRLVGYQSLMAQHHSSSKATLLATAQLTISNQGGCKTRLLTSLDQGSEINLIKDSIVTLLNLSKMQGQVVLSCKADVYDHSPVRS